MFGELVIIGKKVGKLPEAATWALESFCKQRHSFKKSIQTVLSNTSLTSKLTMSSLTALKDDAGPDSGGVEL